MQSQFIHGAVTYYYMYFIGIVPSTMALTVTSRAPVSIYSKVILTGLWPKWTCHCGCKQLSRSFSPRREVLHLSALDSIFFIENTTFHSTVTNIHCHHQLNDETVYGITVHSSYLLRSSEPTFFIFHLVFLSFFFLNQWNGDHYQLYDNARIVHQQWWDSYCQRSMHDMVLATKAGTSLDWPGV